MISKEYNLQDSKKKKKPTLVTTKPNPPTIPSRRTTFGPKTEIERIDKIDKVEKFTRLPASRKSKLEILPKGITNNKVTRLTLAGSVTSKAHDHDNSKYTVTNAALKQTKDNERILAQLDMHYGVTDEFEANKNPKRWSDMSSYQMDLSSSNTYKALYPQSKRKDESSNPNFEDNNLANQVDKLRRPGQYGSTSIRHSNAHESQNNVNANEHVNNNYVTNKLQDITNIGIVKKNVRTNAQVKNESLGANVNLVHSSNIESMVEETLFQEQPKLRSLLVKKNNTDEKNSKSKVKPSRVREDRENVYGPTPAVNLKMEKIIINGEYKESYYSSGRQKEVPKVTTRFSENIERKIELKTLQEDKNIQSVNIDRKLPIIAVTKNNNNIPITGSGHTPNYSSTGGNHPLNSSGLSIKSTNTLNSSTNRSQITLENGEKKSIGRPSTNPQSGSTSSNSQIKSKGGLYKLGNNIQKYSEHKTDSTYVSGGDSISPILDCEETLGNNLATLLTAKNENLSWLDKIEFEMRAVEVVDTETKDKVHGVPNSKNCTSRASMTIEEELANFKPENNACAIDNETIEYLIMRELEYAPDPHYFNSKQTQITWIMRAILIDWMMEVCMEFTLKRETFHYAVNYVDRYLSTIPNVQKWDLQLIGVSAMYLAAKVEEIYAPKVADFARSTDNGYTCQQVVDMELNLIKTLKWFLNPPSLNTWANWYMSQWDLYIENSDYAKSHPLTQSCEDSPIQYKQLNEKSYARYREIMQLIDYGLLDIQTLQYKPRALIASFMYMTLGKYYKEFTSQQICRDFPKSSLYLINNESAFNDLFGDFLLYSFGFQLVDLLPSIQYGSTFFDLPPNFDLPTAAKVNKENVLEGHFEEFLAYQTHHPLNVQYVRKRPRTNI